jgi:hypothetical protein
MDGQFRGAEGLDQDHRQPEYGRRVRGTLPQYQRLKLRRAILFGDRRLSARRLCRSTARHEEPVGRLAAKARPFDDRCSE